MSKISLVSIIDDDAIYQFMMKKMLEDTGQVNSILPYPNGMEAIEYLNKYQMQAEMLPDLIFLDLEMPLMDGWQFLNSYSQIKFGKPIWLYICSSSNSLEDINKSHLYDCVKGYIIKPVESQEIKTIIRYFQASETES